MNPIYKFELTVNGTTERAYPLCNDDLSLSFEKESGEEFFRRKLSGELTFQSVDYQRIDTAAFDTKFLLVMYISYNAGVSWAVYWTGEFWKTDCKFDGDAQTVKVTPTVSDQYTEILAGLDKEYNLIELKPEIVHIKADKRPMVQIYVPGQTVIGCFLSGMGWEQECEAESNVNTLQETYHFALTRTVRQGVVTTQGTPVIPDVFAGTAPAQYAPYSYTNGNYSLTYSYTGEGETVSHTWRIIRISDSAVMWEYTTAEGPGPGPIALSFTMSPVNGSGNVVMDLRDIPVMGRYVCDLGSIGDRATFPIPADDIVPNNRNYHRVLGYEDDEAIYFSPWLSETPTPYGIYQPGLYYDLPSGIWSSEDVFPIAKSAWGRVSLWYSFADVDLTEEEAARTPFVIRDAYPLASVISVLLGKIAPGITHEANVNYSEFLYGVNPISGFDTGFAMTPKSNLINSGYDQPAQRAPITLRNVLDMLRDCFRCYWFIDSNNRLRIEHILYFRNGGSYSGSPVVGVDLTTQEVTRTGKKWAFARDQYTFEKPEMAARYQFGWMDDVTQLFEGYPMDIISGYVDPENIEQINVSRFTSDVDYILLNPNDISKDGFGLLATVQFSFKWIQGGISFTSATRGTPYGSMVTTSSTRIRTPLIPIDSYRVIVGRMTGFNYGFGLFDKDGNFLGRDMSQSFTAVKKELYSEEAKFVAFVIRRPNNSNITPQDGANVPLNVIMGLPELELPYYNYLIEGNDHYLQNAYLAFCMLQRYYAYDMPAPDYTINGERRYAQGVKKLKSQTLRFPSVNDPDLVKLIKTNLGDGVIEKLSVNLSSREANATLRYDTE